MSLMPYAPLGALGDILGQTQFGLSNYQQQSYLGNQMSPLASMLPGQIIPYNSPAGLAAIQQQMAQAQMNALRADAEAQKRCAQEYAKSRAEGIAKQVEDALGKLAFWRGAASVPVIGAAFRFRERSLADKIERLLTEAEAWTARLDTEKELSEQERT